MQLRNLYYFCELCNDTTLQKVLDKKLTAKNVLTIQCSKCKFVKTVLKKMESIIIPVVLSVFEKSITTTAVFNVDSKVAVADRFYVGSDYAEVKCLDLKNGTRIKKGFAFAKDISTIWTKVCDKASVKISISSAGKVKSTALIVESGKRFKIGEKLVLGNKQACIYKIRLKKRTIERGSASANSIVRIYCKEL